MRACVSFFTFHFSFQLLCPLCFCRLLASALFFPSSRDLCIVRVQVTHLKYELAESLSTSYLLPLCLIAASSWPLELELLRMLFAHCTHGDGVKPGEVQFETQLTGLGEWTNRTLQEQHAMLILAPAGL